MYFAMNALNSFMPASFSHAGSVGSLRYCVVIMPAAFSGPAGLITVPTEIDTLVMKKTGFQLRSWILRIACAANFGVAATRIASAPEDWHSVTWLSIVGSVTS